MTRDEAVDKDAVPSKEAARREVYRRLREAGAARFPFPIEGRIPNFQGAERAAARLRELEIYRRARALKVNPDTPQLPVRAMALADGKTLYMPTPRLRGAFLRIRPQDVPRGEERRAAQLSKAAEYGRFVPLAELAPEAAPIDLVVAGAVAVTRDGARAGKGEGYADYEYALLRELGHPELPVVTTVHPLQLVDRLPVDPHDLSVDVVVTPDQVIRTRTPYPKPRGIRWEEVTEEDLQAMPVLRELRALLWERMTVPEVLVPGLAAVFVGLNPGRASATAGHHFAGPNNLFWRLLHEAGFVPRVLRPEEDGLLPRWGLGVTNVVPRATQGEADLTWDELAAGGAVLREKMARVRPRLVVLLGKQVYRAYAGLARTARVEWGPQPRESVPGVREFAAPNPSSRSTVPYEERLRLFREARAWLQDASRA
ncbi:5-formyltetrahydrofolate cyclo-ligase [Thermaerobacter marianensis DSM 12885]|uniref:5-formyltetrahydrofolate cyclo-ligase n=1 Tax=Thermaerobacter marianensis (strain ATCC 700841 / DSM 12885 / JCM 10246 / 7p75a) TaxID=644966 RepID=E6SGZ3_THEM7|nr:5-formyltetrahydrofolate cyclo-ligase [Thermaerobacter marianensis]ADU50624.1 5-formyltetrahydrofolate cyclo-ligase [Thermaerobacter marianensis DSM 12885]